MPCETWGAQTENTGFGACLQTGWGERRGDNRPPPGVTTAPPAPGSGRGARGGHPALRGGPGGAGRGSRPVGVGGGGSQNSAQLREVSRAQEARPGGAGLPGAALTVQPCLPVRSHPQEGLQRGDKSREVSGPAGGRCKQLAPFPSQQGPPRASPGQRTGRPPPPAPTSSRPPPPGPLLPLCIAAGGSGAAGPGADPPARPGMRADTARPGRRRRSAPSGRRHVGPGHVTRSPSG